MKKVTKKSKPKSKSKIKPKKKVVKRKIIKRVAMSKSAKIEGVLIGSVSHYFSDIKVCVIKAKAPFGVGDEIRIIGGKNTDFTQKITSLQVDHRPVKRVKKKDSVGLKVNKKAREGYKVYKV